MTSMIPVVDRRAPFRVCDDDAVMDTVRVASPAGFVKGWRPDFQGLLLEPGRSEWTGQRPVGLRVGAEHKRVLAHAG